MIYVSHDLLNQVEYLIQQSIQGNHVLFDLETIRKVLRTNDRQRALKPEEAYSVEHHIERLIQQPSLAEKQAYLEKLGPEIFQQVVKTYFNIVENSLYESAGVQH